MIRHFGLRNVGCLWWLFLFVCVLFLLFLFGICCSNYRNFCKYFIMILYYDEQLACLPN